MDGVATKSFIVKADAGNWYGNVSPVVFWPDSKHAAYAVRYGDFGGCFLKSGCEKLVSENLHSSVIVDGVEGGKYQEMFLSSGYSVGGRLTWDSPSQLRYLAIKEGKLIEVTETIQ